MRVMTVNHQNPNDGCESYKQPYASQTPLKINDAQQASSG